MVHDGTAAVQDVGHPCSFRLVVWPAAYRQQLRRRQLA
jgi:hypothetical protein